MECPKCGSSVEIMVDVTMLIPAEMEANLSKKNIRDKRVKLYAANWERAAYFCKNGECRWMMRPNRR